MREFLFRGKRRDNGEWYYGSYLFLHVPDCDWTGMRRGPAKDVHFIVDEKDINYAVDPETLGQYTGLTDKNGTEIFDGDVVRISLPVEEHGTISGVSEVYFDKGCFCVNWGGNDFLHRASIDAFTTGSEFEVIGNVYDNIGLLESV